MNLLQAATNYLAGALHEVGGVPVTYRRGAQVKMISAVRNRRKIMARESGGVVIEQTVNTWMINRDELSDFSPSHPERNDKIRDELHGIDYVVRPQSNSGASFDWFGAGQETFVVETSEGREV